MIPSPLPPDFIPFNKPYLVGPELKYIAEAVALGKLSGNGIFTQRCQQFFEQVYGFRKALLTTSGTAALEMAALLLDLQPGDEVILPSFTFTSTANAFVLRGARIVFADSLPYHPNLDCSKVAKLITPRTRAIVPVHYAGVACDMAPLLHLAQKHNLCLVEDAAQAIESTYQGQALGSIGQLAAFSFHETKNIIAGEGGLLAINNPAFAERAEILWEKGTNRAAFFRGEVARYQWVDIGSSYLPSELIAAYLWGQLGALESIQQRRYQQWQRYYEALQPLARQGCFTLPFVPDYARHNAHIFYLLCTSLEERDALIRHLGQHRILAVSHYQPLHASPFYRARHDGRPLPHATAHAERLVRLPLYYELSLPEQQQVIAAVQSFYLGPCAR
ncbi:dTDP-4-amino-4,6-dideoxygalactose transaminase [Hymenobacter sp. HSC-4F20]|uniref:dTDP-4-amino-4,6-dideoxygalactose transaminase n=1 Tax=Hymenobacter sp. HSC-4F20 TaxID=2864135 RepID=UPI001C730378|nr:dTDP-4-amino-4,6-dideoxygalactose transaminase [Hymenobacter sp. HSC-4F20]MBX0292126.1 dTDP-4-amino-4,6-dideoxygalactose transaminase [Hymenobacter sp. HSC-4F20]